ncbi:hypothetical protein BkAM31D_01245 [Halalkalibacter krulwichiae]|uniref:Uncharacterized protein n=1 Tax=Halalkalibacter krulwichiae TaxID=199441 RepID=A0A1X9M7L4_9BACI|nr:hypothetical protein BkAM31D_01245 [Halalkalibacter krulwichiae]
MRMSNKKLFIIISIIVALYGIGYWVIGDILTR